MIFQTMSEPTEFSAWSHEEEDLLENIDKQVQLVSISSSSQSPSSHTKEDNLKTELLKTPKLETVDDVELDQLKDSARQSQDGLMHSPQLDGDGAVPSFIPSNKGMLYSSSCNDLSVMPSESRFDIKFPKSPTGTDLKYKRDNFKRSASCVSLTNNNKKPTGKYDHIQSKVKAYFNDNKTEVVTQQKTKSPVSTINSTPRESKERIKKEEYLEEINKRLTRELDEKNAILTKLQENYEQLLFRYAEAQNRIDQLRFKSINGSAEYSSRTGFKPKSSRTSIRIPLNSFHNAYETEGKDDDVKCQKAIVAPFIKGNDTGDSKSDNVPINRPSSLPIETTNLKVIERDILKAATPTDSEGVSSVITSMSGHSKILNTLDEENVKKTKLLQYQPSDFILQGNSTVNDPFDKVKNWQNSLPPLELIETPDTTLYDIPRPGNIAEADDSPSTNYNEITSSPKIDKLKSHTDEPFPPFYHDKDTSFQTKSDCQKNKLSQAVMKKYLRTLSLPSSLSKRNLMSLIYKRKNHHTIDLCAPMRSELAEDDYVNEQNRANNQKPLPKSDIPSTCIIQRRKKKPPFLRSASLPAYDYDSPKSGSCRNNVFIPPLDLNDLTLSDDETSPRLAYDLSKSNVNTSPSFMTSRGDSIDCSFQTLQTINSCKATVSDYSDSPFVRSSRPIFHKSTSITPDRSKEMIFPEVYERNQMIREKNESAKSGCSPECDMYGSEKKSIDLNNWCNVCGETIAEREAFPYRSNSYQSVEDVNDSVPRTTGRRARNPFIRSVSFNSESNSPSNCFHEPKSFVSPRSSQRRSHDTLEKFDAYANNLKARSQVIMKALTAHVNNS